jgi:hypothetical protein
MRPSDETDPRPALYNATRDRRSTLLQSPSESTSGLYTDIVLLRLFPKEVSALTVTSVFERRLKT